MKQLYITPIVMLLLIILAGCQKSSGVDPVFTTADEGLIKDLALAMVRLPVGDPEDVHYKITLENVARPDTVQGEMTLEALINNVSSGEIDVYSLELIVPIDLAASGSSGDKVIFNRLLADSLVQAGQDGLKLRATFDDYSTTGIYGDCPKELIVISQ